MKPDPVLEALEKVAAKFGKPHPAGTGLGFDLEETNVMSDFLEAVVEDYKQQLVKKLNGMEYRAAARVVENHEYH